MNNKNLMLAPCFLMIVVLFSSCRGQPAAGGGSATTDGSASSVTQAVAADSMPQEIIIDTDMATDDWIAILYLLQDPDVSVRGISVTGTGEAHCAAGVQNALKLITLADEAPIPVGCGRSTPLAGDHTFPQGWRERVDSLGGIVLPEGTNLTPNSNAVDLMHSILQSSTEKMDILALGPLTNLAELVQEDPEVIQHIRMITIMGGAVHVPGNLFSDVPGNQSAEWNIYIDPAAANILFNSGVPITLVPLDACNQARITMEFLQELGEGKRTAEADFVYTALEDVQGFIQTGNYYFWDPLAAAVLVDNNLAGYENDPICVVEEEGPLSGQTAVTEGCPMIRVATSADGERFEQELIQTLDNP